MAARRYHTLDSLRGVAAMAVVLGHTPWTSFRPPHFYLAVDLFFMLSGFVIAYAYEDKLRGGLSTPRFMLARYVRLYPLYILGTAVGILSGAASLYLGKSDLGAVGLAVATVTALLMLPSPTWGRDPSLTPLNQPTWSLIFELLVNLLYAAACIGMRTRTLALWTAAFAVAFVATDLAIPSIHAGFDWSTAWVGAVRVLFSFGAGVLVFRLRPAVLVRSDLAYLAPVLLLALLSGHYSSAHVIELAAILLLFPLLIVVGATVEPRHVLPAVVLGDISYPLYVLHEPILGLASKAMKYLSVELSPTMLNGVVVVAVLGAVSLVLNRWYDIPVRRWLARLTGMRRWTGLARG